MEMQTMEGMRLGKSEHKYDERTLRIARFMLPEIRIPTKFDFDARRRPFATHMWGNDAYGDCVIAGQANHLLRLERVEQRGTIALSDSDAVNRYKQLTGCKNPGDENDTGLYVLDAMRNWRNSGFEQTTKKQRNYKIAAYGELEPEDRHQLRYAIYLLHGIHMGFWLPAAAQGMTSNGYWDYNGESGPEWQPGSWGGHLVFAKKYDDESVYVMTWGTEVKVSSNFIDKYCDEAWAVVDSLDSWRTKETINVGALEKQLSQITTKVNA